MGLYNFFENIEKHFEKGAKWEKYYPLFEMVQTFCFTPKETTKGAPHIRDYVDTKRIMTYVVLAVLPAAIFGIWNIGHQASLVMDTTYQIDGIRGLILNILGYIPGENSVYNNTIFGLSYFLPIYLTTLIVGGIVEVLFAIIRKHEITEGFLVTSMLFTLTLPATTPLWQVALGIAFGVIFGKEIFGGQGKNFMNPALVGRAFLYFAYPSNMTGDNIWVPVDSISVATPLQLAVDGGEGNILDSGYTWQDAFFGYIPGSIGETSTFLILIGLAFLLYTKIANFRLVLGCLAGLIVTTFLFKTNANVDSYFNLNWMWHLVLGGYAFGLAFMVTEPVSGASTNTGRYIYGFLIGFMVVIIRLINGGFVEGMMLAILFANSFAPTIDYFITEANIKRRLKRHE